MFYFLLGLLSFFCETNFDLLFLCAIRLVAFVFFAEVFLLVNNFFPCLISFCEVERNPWKLLLSIRLSEIKRKVKSPGVMPESNRISSSFELFPLIF